MNHVMLTQTTTHRGVTSTKLCTMIEGKKFCEVQDTDPANLGLGLLGIFGGILTWAILSFITYKVITSIFSIREYDDTGLAAALFSLFAPLGYIGLFLVLFG